jgi:hypothetical protein
MFSKFDDAEFADVAAAFGEGAAKPKPKAVSIAPARSSDIGAAPVHKSALPIPTSRPPRPSASKPSPSTSPAARKPAAGSGGGGGSGDTPASLIGPNLSALASQRSSNLTDSSPFAQTLERKSSQALSARSSEAEEIPSAGGRGGGARSRQSAASAQSIPDEEGVGPSEDSASSTRSNAALMKKD